jgi:hypothetical protein
VFDLDGEPEGKLYFFAWFQLIAMVTVNDSTARGLTADFVKRVSIVGQATRSANGKIG